MRQFLKYEFKRNYKSFIFSYFLILVSFIFISIFSLCVKNITNISNILVIIYTNLCLLVFGANGVAIVLFIINLIKSFYNNIFTDEGYLTLSFPKTTDELLLSKVIANFIWVVLLGCSFCVGIIIQLLCIGDNKNKLFEIFTSVVETFSSNESILFSIINSSINIILIFLLLLLSFTLINLGNLKKGKLFLGLLIFSGISYVYNIIEALFGLFGFGIAIDGNDNLMFAFGSELSSDFINSGAVSYVFSIPEFILQVGVIILTYFLTRYLLKNKIEIE